MQYWRIVETRSDGTQNDVFAARFDFETAKYFLEDLAAYFKENGQFVERENENRIHVVSFYAGHLFYEIEEIK